MLTLDAAPHHVTIARQVQTLPPQDGWACQETTNHGWATCPCGFNTGLVDKTEAGRLGYQHAGLPHPGGQKP
ncbi:hypothetical protein AB0I77_29615 [Streptomyces sp. NPDC050619]|uniref:hypothetical protein n=1 Tax=Streptomyces sp. NPDC050619 TaxID=3157214 RepID=UPI003421E49E